MPHTRTAERSAFRTLNEATAHWALTRPEALAVNFLDGDAQTSLTYRELHERALKVAGHLAEVTRPGDRAVLVYPQGVDYIASFLGCSYAGVVAVTGASPDEARKMQRLVGLIADSGAEVVLADADTMQKLPLVLAQADQSPRVLVTDSLHDGRLPKPLSVPETDLMFLQYTSGSTSAPKGVMLSHRSLVANLELIKHLTRQHDRSVHVSWLPLFHDMGLIFMTLSALYAGRPLHLMSPAEFLRNPLRWLELISTCRGTVTAAPDFAYQLCLDHATPEKLRRLDLSSLEFMVNGAEPIRVGNAETFYETFKGAGLRREAMIGGYGMAEVAVAATLGPMLGQTVAFDRRTLEADGIACPCEPDDPHGRLVAPCGPISRDRFDIRIVDPRTGTLLDPGRVGEVWLSGPSVADGYWDNPKATRAAFNARYAGSDQPFLRTGDLGFTLNSQLYICGRMKEMMIVRGRNVFPGDICAVVEEATPAMKGRRASAFGVTGVQGEELVIACAARVNADTYQAEARRITAAVSQELGVAPAAVLFVQSRQLKRTTSGKVQHGAMQQDYLAGLLESSFKVVHSSTLDAGLHPCRAGADPGTGEATSHAAGVPEGCTAGTAAGTAPGDDVPAWVVTGVRQACATVCNCGSVGVHENLFECGLDSLRAMQLLQSLAVEFEIARRVLSLSELQKLKSPHSIAEALWASVVAQSAGLQSDFVEMTV